MQRDLEIRLLENRINTLNLELADKTLQLISLFQGGGPIVEGVSGTGESIQREATSQHVDTVSTCQSDVIRVYETQLQDRADIEMNYLP